MPSLLLILVGKCNSLSIVCNPSPLGHNSSGDIYFIVGDISGTISSINKVITLCVSEYPYGSKCSITFSVLRYINKLACELISAPEPEIKEIGTIKI